VVRSPRRRGRTAAGTAGLHSLSRDSAVQDPRRRRRHGAAAAGVARDAATGSSVAAAQPSVAGARRRTPSGTVSAARKAFAWLVHLYTALGLVCAAGKVELHDRGDEHSLCLAFL